MKFSQYYPVDVINGPGTRCTLFVSGCSHQCRGCYNQSTWSPDAGQPFDEVMTAQIIADLQDSKIRRRGLSLTGGDPLHPANCEDVLKLVQAVKAQCPGKDIWLWTGYRLAEMNLLQRKILEYVDMLVDGKFEQELADANLIWRGSSNQVVYQQSEQGFVASSRFD